MAYISAQVAGAVMLVGLEVVRRVRQIVEARHNALVIGIALFALGAVEIQECLLMD